MKHKKTFFIITAFIASLFCAAPASALDCTSPLENLDTTARLKGNWLFQKSDNPEWKQPNFDDSGWQRKSLPDYGKDSSSKSYGYFWYRCHIFLKNKDSKSLNLAVNLGVLRDADEVYFNGTLIGSTGKFSPSLIPETEKERVYSIPDSILLEGKNVLAVRVFSSTSSFGIGSIPAIGREESVIQSYFAKNIISIVFGFIFILMGLFFILSSVVRTGTRANAFFSLFSISLGIYTLIRTPYRYVFFDEFSTSFTTELVVLFTLPPLFIAFFAEFLHISRNKYTYAYEAVLLILAVYTLFSAKTSANWSRIISVNAVLLSFPSSLLVYWIYNHYERNKFRLKPLVFGTIGLFPCVVLDAVRAMDIIALPQTIHFGFMIFLISISVQLSEEMVEHYKNFQKQELELFKMEKAKTNFLFNVAEEFKSYLDESKKLIQSLTKENYSGKELTDRLLNMESLGGLKKAMIHDAELLHSVESRQFEYFTERFSLREMINEILTMLETRHRQKRNSLSVSFQQDIDMQQSKELVFHVIYHILENIFLYTPEESPASVNVSLLGKTVELKFRDSGPGMNPEEAAN
ncbi:MAG TPA: 7TM diverse intracellular signaling domain-containing protein, partial [Leptospiraceae bacterium]|nr:7TM diverse intracellular signaling domain-containing protein [Leptospiraceae bacterium]